MVPIMFSIKKNQSQKKHQANVKIIYFMTEIGKRQIVSEIILWSTST